MDGYPMNSTQAATFVQLIGPPSVVIHLDVPPAVMNDRLRKRKNFDDSQEAIYTKIDKFTSVTMPLVRKWNGITIDATREIPEVLKDLKEVLKSQNAFEEKELDVAIQWQNMFICVHEWEDSLFQWQNNNHMYRTLEIKTMANAIFETTWGVLSC